MLLKVNMRRLVKSNRAEEGFIFTFIKYRFYNKGYGFYIRVNNLDVELIFIIFNYKLHKYKRGRVRGKRVYGDKLSNSGDFLKLKVPSSS